MFILFFVERKNASAILAFGRVWIGVHLPFIQNVCKADLARVVINQQCFRVVLDLLIADGARLFPTRVADQAAFYSWQGLKGGLGVPESAARDNGSFNILVLLG